MVQRERKLSIRDERLGIAGINMPVSPNCSPAKHDYTMMASKATPPARAACDSPMPTSNSHSSHGSHNNASDNYSSSIPMLSSMADSDVDYSSGVKVDPLLGVTVVPGPTTPPEYMATQTPPAAPCGRPRMPPPPPPPSCRSRPMDMNDLNQLKDWLYKNSMSGSTTRFSGLSQSRVSGVPMMGVPSLVGAPSFSGLSSYAGNNFVDAMRYTEDALGVHAKGAVTTMDTATSSFSMGVQPSQLPRESMVMLIDAVRGSNLHGDDKCRFLFDLFDVDQAHVLSKEGVTAFLETTFLMNNVQFYGNLQFNDIVNKVFACNNNKETMTFSEFKNIFGDMVEGGRASIYHAPIDDHAHRKSVMNGQPLQPHVIYDDPPRQLGLWGNMVRYYRKHDRELFWVAIYVALMITAFAAKFSRFNFDPAVGNSARIAKGFAQIVMVNTLFVLLPMCRNFVTSLRELHWVASRLPLDQHIEFHKICGVVMLLASLGHTIGWIFIVYYAKTVPLEVWEQSAFHHLQFVRTETIWQLCGRVPIWTGLLMLLLAGIAAPLTHSKIRSGKFNAFWFAHLLFIPFLLLIMVHGLAMWVAPPQAYMWVSAPCIIYSVEKRYRMGNVFGGKTSISRVHVSPDTIAIYMKKPRTFGKGRSFYPGMFLYLNVPVLSRFEWHPFTISSAPEDEYLSVHVRKAGDWTSALYDLLSKMKDNNPRREHLDLENHTDEHMSPYPTICIDGPVGAPSQDYYRHRVLVFVAAGIGVTPFASILRSIVYQWESFRCPCCQHVSFPKCFHIQKIYFYWVTREQESLTWFSETMNQLSAMDSDNRLEIHNYFSPLKRESVVAPLRALQTLIHGTEGQDIISGLTTKQMTHFGRPDWKNELNRIARTHVPRRQEPQGPHHIQDDFVENEDIGVFFCGPKRLGADLQDECHTVNQRMKHEKVQVSFDFHSENF
ncbi:TPA: hypothetical protein N0F65_002480 [Lagenidium giganteum]|uniref:FAD-binding FR-type domain-containing protein n=1 Tax=Lagenidium giganteum TaxID=4803 RepID=A0AAV2YUZ8_9STRA|nr:TPA: hypothetical protein N0F65_002480 [Lagenidium giganteum]